MGRMSELEDELRMEREKNKAMLEHKLGDWPLGFVLPVKKFDGLHWDVGFVSADFPTVILTEFPSPQGLILQLRWELNVQEMEELGFFDPRKLYGEKSKELYDAVVKHRYESIDAMLDDGWKVD